MGEIKTESKQLKLKEYENLRIRPDDIIEEEQTILSIIEGMDIEKPICSLGDFSMIIGKAKSKKTFALSIAISAFITNGLVQNKIKASLPKNKCNVLYFDTEQSKNHLLKCVKRICIMSNIDCQENLITYTLRAFSPKERLSKIQEIIANTENVGFVVIDGIKDLVSSINDEEQSSKISTWLLTETKDRGIHIMVVLHENKGDANARGHLGTELVNKAETVLSITKDSSNKDISIVESKFSRNIEIEEFSFQINSDGLPIINSDYIKKEVKIPRKSIIANEIDDNTHKSVLTSLFENFPQPKYAELWRQLKVEIQTYTRSIGDSKAKEFIGYYLKKGWIEKIGIGNTSATYYTLKERLG